MLDQVHFMASNLLMGGEAKAATEQHEPRYVYRDGRWVNEVYDPATGTWVAEDQSAADAREAQLTKGYAHSEPVAAAAPPPPMGGMMSGPPQGDPSPRSGQRFSVAGSKYVDVMQQPHGY